MKQGTGRTTIYLGDYVVPTAKMNVVDGCGLVGWGPDTEQPGCVVETDGENAIVEILGGMVLHSRTHHPDRPVRAEVSLRDLCRVEVFLVPKRYGKGGPYSNATN